MGVAKSTLEKKRVTGEGPRYLKIGRTVLYDTDDLDDYMFRRRRHSTSEPDPTPQRRRTTVRPGQ
jgi:hypothetical protein